MVEILLINATSIGLTAGAIYGIVKVAKNKKLGKEEAVTSQASKQSLRGLDADYVGLDAVGLDMA